jgi:hypothetical protein
MKDISPKKKSGGATSAARSEQNRTGILVSGNYSVNHVLAQRRKEAARIWPEYECTGNHAHISAYELHRAGIPAQ